MLDEEVILEIKKLKEEISSFIKRLKEISCSEINYGEESFFSFIAKHIILFKELYRYENKYYYKVMISDMFFYILSISKIETRYIYVNQRSIIENYMRSILSVTVEENHITNSLFEKLKDDYEIPEEIYALLKGEYYTACSYIHGGKLLEENLVSFFNETINKKVKINSINRYYQRITKLMQEFDKLLIISNYNYINGVFHRRKSVLKYLIGEKLVKLLIGLDY
ncbi:MAG: hypothetical protein MRZ58_00090 [Fusobacterium varium]|nr:hypothetical protein [Fusobacterium varium]